MFSGSPKATTDGIAYVAMAMMVGLVPFSAQYLFQRVFYAFEDARTPFLVQVPIVGIWALGNVISVIVLPAEWIVVGVGASMTVANTTGAALSYYLLHRRFGELDGGRVLSTHLKMLVAAATGGVVAFLIGQGVHAVLGEEKLASMVAALLGAVALVGIYVLLLRRLKVTELDDALLPLIKRR